MHSSKKIEEAYPGYGDAIRELYTGSYNDRPLSRNRTVTKMLDSVIYDDFINVTSNEFIIFGCRYMNTGCRCLLCKASSFGSYIVSPAMPGYRVNRQKSFCAGLVQEWYTMLFAILGKDIVLSPLCWKSIYK